MITTLSGVSNIPQGANHTSNDTRLEALSNWQRIESVVYVINFNRCQVAAKDFPSERFIVDYVVRTVRGKRERARVRKKTQLKYINSLVALSEYHCPAIMNRPSTFLLHSSVVSRIDFHWSYDSLLIILVELLFALSFRQCKKSHYVEHESVWFPRFFIVTRTSRELSFVDCKILFYTTK